MTEKNKGSEILRPRARIIRTIGDELINNDFVAVIELVKNSYDADARRVTVKFEPPLEKGKGRILVIDDGVGMDFNTIKTGWLEPASLMKKKKRKTTRGRAVLGEKGVGRFAAAKLSSKMEMVTRTKGHSEEITVCFDWSKFGDDKYLDEVECRWERRPATIIKNQGTVLVLENLNLDWDIDKLTQLRTYLSRMVSPFKKVRDFSIYLELPRVFEKLSGEVDASPALSHPKYSIKGSVDEKGHYALEYQSIDTAPTKLTGDFCIPLKSKKDARPPSCGPFDIEFRIWDLDKNDLEDLISKTKQKITLNNLRGDINQAAGLSIYRDDFRVHPYGGRDNDWLRLDMRRVQNPTLRLSNNQVVGNIAISLEENPGLKDQSNREGIVDSMDFSDLKHLVIEVINLLEQRRFKERRKSRDGEHAEVHEGILSGITAEPLKKIIEEKLPNDRDAIQLAKKTEDALQEKVQKIREVISRYRRLATLGQLIDIVLHDGHSAVSKIGSEVLLFESDLESKNISLAKIKKRLGFIKQSANLLSNLFQRIEPFGGRRRGKPKDFLLEVAINNCFLIHERELRETKIDYTIPKTSTHAQMDDVELQEIIINLLTNSIHWLGTVKDRQRKIVVEIGKSAHGVEIIFSDNGPGVPEENAETIFYPYFSTKQDGVGLGLTIAGELTNEMGGDLELLKDGSLGGASFRIFIPIKE